MTREELSNQLKTRQQKFLNSEKARKNFSKQQIDSIKESLLDISDEDMINSYIKCSDCGNFFINIEQLPGIILECVDVEDFLKMTENINLHNH